METVRITIPASPQYVQVVRLVAAGLAARLHFTIDEIEDLKIAVDELVTYLTGTRGRSGAIELSFRVGDDRLEISGVGRFPPEEEVRTELTDLSKMILDTVVDEASLVRDGGAPGFTLVKSKTP